MKVEILYFASVREAVGRDRERVVLPPGIEDTASLRGWLRARGGPWAEALSEARPVRVAVDQSMAGPQTRLHEGAEVAFFPPVTGG